VLKTTSPVEDQQFYLFLSFAQRNNVSDPERIAVIEFAEDIVS